MLLADEVVMQLRGLVLAVIVVVVVAVETPWVALQRELFLVELQVVAVVSYRF